jgi:hypothetical protein
MNESTNSPAFGAAVADIDDSSEYRIREVEARLDRRLVTLEAQRARAAWTARLTGAGLVLTLGVLAWVVGSVVPNDDAWTVGSLSAQEVVLRDVDGVERGRLAADDDGRAQLSLSDPDGRERVRLTVLADGSPGITISDADARPRAILAYLPDGTANLVFADARGVSRAVFGVEPDGSSQALFTDRAGDIRTLVGVGTDDEPSVSVFEGNEGGSPGS